MTLRISLISILVTLVGVFLGFSYACASEPEESSAFPGATATSEAASKKTISDGEEFDAREAENIGYSTTCRCSAVSVSPKKMLTASHCLENDCFDTAKQAFLFHFPTGLPSSFWTCNRASGADLAVCTLQVSGKLTGDFPSINRKKSVLVAGSQVIFVGRSPFGGGGSKPRQGVGKLESDPDSSAACVWARSTTGTKAQPADSGGPVFVEAAGDLLLAGLIQEHPPNGKTGACVVSTASDVVSEFLTANGL